jgi:hypothetical protein
MPGLNDAITKHWRKRARRAEAEIELLREEMARLILFIRRENEMKQMTKQSYEEAA